MKYHTDIVAHTIKELELIPLKSDYLYHMDRFEITGISHKFDIIPFGEIPPDYCVIFDTQEYGMPNIYVERIDG